jgi:hypothetical protein
MDGRRCGIGFGLGGDDESGAPSPEPMDVTGAPSLEQMAAGDWNSARNTERRVRGVGGPGRTNWVAYKSFFTYRWYLWVNNSELHV